MEIYSWEKNILSNSSPSPPLLWLRYEMRSLFQIRMRIFFVCEFSGILSTWQNPGKNLTLNTQLRKTKFCKASGDEFNTTRAGQGRPIDHYGKKKHYLFYLSPEAKIGLVKFKFPFQGALGRSLNGSSGWGLKLFLFSDGNDKPEELPARSQVGDGGCEKLFRRTPIMNLS